MVSCLECIKRKGKSKDYGMLNKHLIFCHRMTTKEYNQEFPGEPLYSYSVRKKISSKITGLKRSEETKRKIRENKERSRKISESLKGRVFTEKWKKNISLNHANVSGSNNPMYGKHHSPETCEKQSKRKLEWCKNHPGFQDGEKNSMWNNGKSFESYPREFNKHLKNMVRILNGNKCYICKKEKPSMFVHHVDYNKKNNQIENLVLLCRRCHAMTNTKRQFWKVYFQNKDKSLGELIVIALKNPSFFEVN